MMKSKLSWVRRSQRMIRMVSELHRMGYQRLRIMPYSHPLAWRLAIAPAEHFCDGNGAVLKSGCWDVPIYSAASEDDYFDWNDAHGDNARQLAEKFVDRFPVIAERGKGRDWAYAGWLAELVGLLEGGDLLPVMEWENMHGAAESLRFVPIWEIGAENIEWIHEHTSPVSIPAKNIMKVPLPPEVDQIEDFIEITSGLEHWSKDRYWTEALDHYVRLRDGGKEFFSINIRDVETTVFDGNSPAYKLMDAMASVREHESNEGFKGAPRLTLALLLILEELSNRNNH